MKERGRLQVGNLAFEIPTIPAPDQGLGAALQWRMNEQWTLLGGIANANGNAAEPIDSAQELFESGETFYDRAVQLTVWQVDDRAEAGDVHP